jgi:hypothetical protein
MKSNTESKALQPTSSIKHFIDTQISCVFKIKKGIRLDAL